MEGFVAVSTDFPNGVDAFFNPTATTALNSASAPHAQQHTDLNDAVNAVESFLLRNLDPDVSPSSPATINDEFFGGGSINAKWSITNNPAGVDALNQNDFEGFLTVGLIEQSGTDNFANGVRIHQTPPSGSWDVRAKVALGIDDGFPAEEGEFAAATLYIANSTGSEFLNSGLQFNNASGSFWPLHAVADKEDAAIGFVRWSVAIDLMKMIVPTQFYYVRLAKTTAGSYTTTNTYRSYISANGVIWHLVAEEQRAFAASADEIGLLFRRPKNQGGTPHARVLVDWFRQV